MRNGRPVRMTKVRHNTKQSAFTVPSQANARSPARSQAVAGAPLSSWVLAMLAWIM